MTTQQPSGRIPSTLVVFDKAHRFHTQSLTNVPSNNVEVNTYYIKFGKQLMLHGEGNNNNDDTVIEIIKQSRSSGLQIFSTVILITTRLSTSMQNYLSIEICYLLVVQFLISFIRKRFTKHDVRFFNLTVLQAHVIQITPDTHRLVQHTVFTVRVCVCVCCLLYTSRCV